MLFCENIHMFVFGMVPCQGEDDNLMGNCLIYELIGFLSNMHSSTEREKGRIVHCMIEAVCCLIEWSFLIFKKITGFLSVILEIVVPRKISNLQQVELKSGGQLTEGVLQPDWAGNNSKVLVISHIAASH